MSSTKRIICLSNSYKLSERCIAGIDVNSGKWVRPVCDSLHPQDGKVPEKTRIVEGREPELLDILDIPLNDTGNDFGFECENLTILPGEWRLIGKANPNDLVSYCGSFVNILHNSSKYVNPSYLRSLDFNQRRTLQLLQTTKFSATRKTTGSAGWQGTITTTNGQTLAGATITDPVFVEKLGDFQE